MVAVPNNAAKSLLARDSYVCDYYGCYYSPWYAWQRWVVLGVLLVITAIVLLSCACLSARRRRRRGLPPYYGTAWTAPPAYDVNNMGNHNSTGPQYGGHVYASNGYNNGNTPAPYNPAGSPPPPPPGYNASNMGYYGQQGAPNSNYEMGNYGSGSNAPYVPPRPQEAHISKH